MTQMITEANAPRTLPAITAGVILRWESELDAALSESCQLTLEIFVTYEEVCREEGLLRVVVTILLKSEKTCQVLRTTSKRRTWC